MIKGPQNEKARDMFLRRKAERLGLVLKKDLNHKRTNEHQGGYMIVNAGTGSIEVGQNFELTPEQIDTF